MSGPQRQGKVLLMSLSIRMSAKGTVYLSGWLGKAQVVAVAGEPDKYGNETWDVLVSEPAPRDDAAVSARASPAAETAPGRTIR